MPPVRTMPVIKPTKTERSHEENQERAYIAASRRSDRSLEARVESARRASEIHEKRTGRRLRVTEQDVINEEMYEEEDDNIPWRYRHLALLPNLSTLSPDFRRRVEAQLVLDLERSRMVDPLGQFQHSQFMNPGMMMQQPGSGFMYPPSMYQFGQQPSALSPQTSLFPQQSPLMQAQSNPRTPSTHRTTPYPIPNAQQPNARPGSHHRSASIANPQNAAEYQQQHPQSAQASSEARSESERRMSLPPPASAPRDSTSPNQSKVTETARSASGRSPPSPHSSVSQKTPTSPMQGLPQFSRSPYSFNNPYAGAYPDTNPYAPLTSALPLNTQQILGGDMFDPNFMDDPKAQMLLNNPSSNVMNQPMYSYNPNPNSKTSKKRPYDQISTSTGLDQTLMPTSTNASNDAGFLGTSLSDGNAAGLTSAVTDTGFGFGGAHEDGYAGLDAFGSSGQRTPDDFNSFVNDDFFGDQQYAF